MKSSKLNLESFLYILALAVAGFFRFIKLGLPPLGDFEAQQALQALILWRPGTGLASGLSGYSLWTSLLFELFEPSNFLSRFWPAIFGTLLVLGPWLFRNWLGRVPAILLAWGLAVSPGLIAISRQAGSSGIAIPAFVLAVGLFLGGFSAASGIMAGIALISGTTIWMGILICTVALLWDKLLSHKPRLLKDVEPEAPQQLPWKRSISWMGATVLIAGTLFFRQPAGLGALGTNLMSFIQGWVYPGEISMVQALAAWLGYEFFAIVFGLLGFLSGWWRKHRLEILLGRIVLISILFGLLYPARQPGDLAWMLLPLWGLAALGLHGLLRSFDEAWLPVLGHFLLVVILLVFSTVTFLSLTNNPQAGDVENKIHWISLAGSLGTIVVVTILIAWGWSIHTARYGFVLAMFCYLLIFNFSASWNAALLGRNPSAEAWQPSPYYQDADLMLQTLEDTSRRASGDRNTLEVIMVDFDSPSLTWMLRDRSLVSKAVSIPSQSQPPIIVTNGDELGQVAESYTGQDFILARAPIWGQLELREWFTWLVYRDSSEVPFPVILWIRADLLPGNATSTGGEIRP